jgi:Bacterial PH domain
VSGPKWRYPYPRWGIDRWLTLHFAICSTLLFPCIGFGVLVATSSALSPWGWLAATFGALVIAAIIAVQWRQVLAGLAVGDAGVRVRTVLSTRVMPWSEIRDFVADEADPGPWEWLARTGTWHWHDPAVLGVFVKLRTGELVRTPIRLGARPTFTMGTNRWTPGGPDEFLYSYQGQAVLAALRQQLGQHATAATSGAGGDGSQGI